MFYHQLDGQSATVYIFPGIISHQVVGGRPASIDGAISYQPSCENVFLLSSHDVRSPHVACAVGAQLSLAPSDDATREKSMNVISSKWKLV